ncbi:MAG TPA: FtsQ-type POTRA domain-containing protein [Ktedonobacteraceae bacterium]|nr:FtsQ-type POTRA domain-containing protein [Ktedonobacteraceae bacterium]
MTKKQPEGQYTRRYRYRATISVSRPLVRRNEASQQSPHQVVPVTRRRTVRLDQGEQRSIALRRRVTMPHEAIRPLTWAERKQLYHQPHLEKKPEQPVLVSRTLLQTGRPAPVGQMRTSRPLTHRGTGHSPVPARRRKQRNKGIIARILGFMAVMALLIAGISFAMTSATFHIQQLTINGTENPGLISSIQRMGIEGQNIFLFDSTAMTARLNMLPLVASASLAVQLPNSVIVNIRERVPVLLWQSGKNTFGVSQDGVVIAPVNQLRSTNGLVPVVDKRTNVRVQPGTHLASSDVLFVEQMLQQLSGIQGVAPYTLQYVNQIEVSGRSEPANVAGRGSYVISSASGWLAYLGDAQNSNSLANRLQELRQILSMAQAQHLNLETIDLRFGTRPTYTLKS